MFNYSSNFGERLKELNNDKTEETLRPMTERSTLTTKDRNKKMNIKK